MNVREVAYAQLFRMREAGESHEMCARWISEALTPEVEAQAERIAELESALESAEAKLNEIRDEMIDDRSQYDGLLYHAGRVEKVAVGIRQVIS